MASTAQIELVRAFCATVKTIGIDPLSKLINSAQDTAEIVPTLLEKFIGFLKKFADEEVRDHGSFI